MSASAALSHSDIETGTTVIDDCTKSVAIAHRQEENALLSGEDSVRYKNRLFAADNLSVLQEQIGPETVDLVYLDPPFNSKQDYNVIFRERQGRRSTSQQLVFKDTWTWSPHTEELCRMLEESGGRLSDAVRALRIFLGSSDMMAYLVMMAPRLRELHRVLKPTGSIYMHCDPTASHYLKMLMDAVFGPTNMRNEIVWKRTGAHNSAKRYGPVHDIIFFYSKTNRYTWNQQYQPQEEYIRKRYTYVDDRGRRFYPVSLIAAGVRHGSSGRTWHGIDVTAHGNHWRYTIDGLDKLDAKGDIYWPERGGKPRLKMYADKAKGSLVQDWWGDIPPLNSQSQERLGYPTQKPLALLERMILASSKEGDLILDPFCGCGTAIEAAEKNQRRWMGIDITLLAAAVIKNRLANAFGPTIFKSIDIVGEPPNIEEAEALASENKFGFQWWAVGRLGAPPIEQKKGRDRGVDGRIYFHDDAGAAKHIVISVKAGEHVGPAAVRELRGVVERDRASMGILVTVKQRTQEMLREASIAGLYRSINGSFPKLQVITVGDIFAEKPLDIPGRKINPYEPKRPMSVRPQAEQLRLLP